MSILVTGATADRADEGGAGPGWRPRRALGFVGLGNTEGSPSSAERPAFLSTAELAAFSDRVAAAEPFLGKLVSDMSLRGLFKVLGLAATGITEHGQDPGDLGHVMTMIGDTVESVAKGSARPLSWRALMSPSPLKPEDYHQVILAQVRTAGSPDSAAALAAIRQIAAGLGIGPAHGTRVDFTGDLPLGVDEVQAVTQGGERAGLVSLALVSIIAYFGLRSLRLVAALMATLVISLVWTSAFAALLRPSHLLSASFAVLFIGVAMYFSVQFGLRFQEARNRGRDTRVALDEATSRTGTAITLAAVSAAVGFFSFVPTAYRGLAELGIISGVGMLIGLLATLALLPAILTLMPVPARPQHAAKPERAKRPDHFIVRHARAIGAAALLLGLLSLATLPRAGFEVDPIKLENPASQSVRAYNELMADSRASPYSISVLAPNLDAADALAKKLGTEPLVGNVVTLSSFVPDDQADKLAIIDQMSLFLLPVFEPVDVPPAPTLPQNRSALAPLVAELGQLAASPKAGDLAAPAKRLATLLDDFAKGAGDSAQRFRDLDQALLGNLPGRLTSLRDALGASKVTLANLPTELKVRYLSADGRAHIEISPKQRFAGTRQLRRFVDGVRSIAPGATGTAVLLLDGADAVVGAFERSGVLAFIGVSLLLILTLRSIVDWLLVAIPLALALSFTIATIVLLDTKLNLANIMALPLLFTLGSAFGVYLVMRSREIPRVGQLFRTSTPRAVLVSALTTMASLGSLMVSSHRGMASMGELLAISLSIALATNLIVLPALLAWRESRRDALAAAVKP
jgi:hopanoid biosynthesis associated RND transporter like protein HpnN